MLFRRHTRLPDEARAALAGSSATHVRARAAEERAGAGGVAAGGRDRVGDGVAGKGLEATVALCEQLQAQGFRAVPHLSARMVRDVAHLRDLIAWLEGANVDRAFVVGGDAKEPGDFLDGLSLLARDARDRSSARRDRDPVLSAGPRVHRRCTAARLRSTRRPATRTT